MCNHDSSLRKWKPCHRAVSHQSVNFNIGCQKLTFDSNEVVNIHRLEGGTEYQIVTFLYDFCLKLSMRFLK